MTTAIKRFNRYELKYVLNQEGLPPILKDLEQYLAPDRHGEDGTGYAVTSLYYDTPDYKAYWDKINGHRFRRKLRIRVYGEDFVGPETTVFVEIKQRVNKTLQKRRMMTPYQVAVDLCNTGETDYQFADEDQPLADEIQYLTKTLDLRPTCVVAYKRLAYHGTDYDPGLRITFDSHLKSRVHDLSLLSQNYAENTYFIPPDWTVMEIKVNNRVPYWVTQLIGKHNCTLRRVGKYCTALEEAKIPFYQRRINE